MLSNSPSASLWRPMEAEAQATSSAEVSAKVDPIQLNENVEASAKAEPTLSAEVTNAVYKRETIELSYLPIRKANLKTGQMASINYQNRDDDCSPFGGNNHEFLWGISYEYQHFLNGDSYLDTEQMYFHSIGFNGRLNQGRIFFESGINPFPDIAVV